MHSETVSSSGRGWADPADKDRAKLSQDGYLAHLTDNKNPKKAITQFISSQVEQGLIENRADIIKSLSENRRSNTARRELSINQTRSFEKAIRLKGDLYERRFNTKSYLEAERKNSSEPRRGGRTDVRELSKQIKELQSFIASRSRYNQQRYPAGAIKSLENTPVNRLHGLPEHLRSHLGTDVIPVISDNKPDQTNRRDGSRSERGENPGRDSERAENHENTAQHVRNGLDNQKVRKEKLICIQIDEKAVKYKDGFSSTNKQKIEGQHDRARELFTKISADVARRVRDARESVQRFISNLTNSKSRFNETIQRSERAIKRNDRSIQQNAGSIQRIDRSIQQNDRSIQSVTEQQRHSSQISLAIAKRAREIEQRRSRWRDLGWER